MYRVVQCRRGFINLNRRILILFVRLVRDVRIRRLSTHFNMSYLFISLLHRFFRHVFHIFIPMASQRLRRLTIRSSRTMISHPYVSPRVTFHRTRYLRFKWPDRSFFRGNFSVPSIKSISTTRTVFRAIRFLRHRLFVVCFHRRSPPTKNSSVCRHVMLRLLISRLHLMVICVAVGRLLSLYCGIAR